MAVTAVYLAEQPVRQVSLIDCWCGPTGAKRCRSHNKRRCATALKCSSSFTISSALAEYWALQACLPRSFDVVFFPTIAFFPYLHIMEALFPLSTPVRERRGKKRAPKRVNRTACLKTLCYLVAGKKKKKTKSICHQMHRVMINKVGPN